MTNAIIYAKNEDVTDKEFMTIKINKLEIETILDWYETVSAEMMHYGDGDASFPFEQSIISKLSDSGDGTTLLDHEIRIVHNWMEKAVIKKYGPQKFLLPIEERLYNKLTSALEQSR